jgi:hypothetical protein
MPNARFRLSRLLAIGCMLWVMWMASACSVNRYGLASGLPDPDSGVITGSVAGYSAYFWDCFQDKHIVIFNSSSEMYVGAYERQEAVCGQTTPIEETLKTERVQRPLDPKTFWK